MVKFGKKVVKFSYTDYYYQYFTVDTGNSGIY